MRALIFAVLVSSGVALAAPLKLAVVYGHNGGTQTRPALRFAQNDAARVAATLIEVAQVQRADLKLLQGAPREAFEAALDWAAARIATHRAAGGQAILYVYVSSHGDDGRGLELGAQTISWADLKTRLAATKADVRVAFIDACNASGLLEAGGRSASGFELRADDRLTVAGEAVITSSASNEPSLEAGAYKGSVFTHHLLGALRGAADRSGDGKVSLEETYRYAYARTVEGDSGQHPGYGFKLAGHGELQLSSVKGGARLLLPKNVDAVTISDPDTADRYLEVRAPEGRVIALPAGRWEVRVWRGGKAKGGRVTLAAGQQLAIDESALTPVPAATAQLVRLSAAAHYCLKSLAGPDAKLAQQLKAALEALEGHACFEGSAPVALTVRRERAQQIRVVGSVGGRAVDVLSDEAALAGDVARALAAGL